MHQKNPELWASTSRIFSCIVIYIYHYGSLYGKDLSPIDFFAILIFVFLSGYFSVDAQTKSFKDFVVWLLKRGLAIMIPYWPVIALVIFFNELYQYKETGFGEYLIIILGGSMFLDNPVYVISWFITLILWLYFYIFLIQVVKKKEIKSLVFVFGLAISLVFHKEFYFLAFNAGCVYKSRVLLKGAAPKRGNGSKLSEMLFFVQNYCYCFFLLHGGVLLFSIKVLRLSAVICFVFSFILSGIGSVILFSISNRFQKKVLISIEKHINLEVN